MEGGVCRTIGMKLEDRGRVGKISAGLRDVLVLRVPEILQRYL
jgi:hypothetical protein